MTEIDNQIGALYAYDVPEAGPPTKLDIDKLEPLSAKHAYRWVHLDQAHDAARDWLANRIDAVMADSLVQDDTRPRFARHEDGFLLILRGVNTNPAADPEDMVSIRLWVCERHIISVRRRRLMAVVAIREALDVGDGPRSPGAFLCALAEGMTERMVPVIDGIADEVDELEEKSLDGVGGLRARLASLRRTTIALRRYIGPQREALSRLAAEGGAILGDEEKSKLREIVDRITRLVEDMDAIRERCGVLNDQLADARAEEMNRNMMVLSVVAAIFLPLGFLTGLLGVNVGGIPGADTPHAFAVLCLAMAMIGGLITWFFKYLKWL